jgi:hypothetical protein
MLNSASGIIIIQQEPDIREFPWKNGVFLSFKAVSQEATAERTARLHHYLINTWVPSDELERWRRRIQPGTMFLLTNGGVSAAILEGKEYPFNQIKVNRNNLNYLKKQVEKEK